MLEIIDYRPEHQPWFEKLNRGWIEKYFSMEPPDYDMLQDPYEHVLKKGGSIFIAVWDGVVAGTVALKRLPGDVYELTKMGLMKIIRVKRSVAPWRKLRLPGHSVPEEEK